MFNRDQIRSQGAILVFVVTVLSGCDGLEHFSNPPKQLIVEVENLSNVQRIENVLARRFHEYPVSIISSFDSKIEGHRISFTFKRGAPDRGIVDFLVQNQGKLVARTEEGDIWFSSKDIENFSVGLADDIYSLQFSLSDAAAERMAELSQQNIGKVLLIELDGKLLRGATVTVKLGKRFAVDVDKEPKELLLIEALLRSGTLPEKVTILKNEI